MIRGQIIAFMQPARHCRVSYLGFQFPILDLVCYRKIIIMISLICRVAFWAFSFAPFLNIFTTVGYLGGVLWWRSGAPANRSVCQHPTTSLPELQSSCREERCLRSRTLPLLSVCLDISICFYHDIPTMAAITVGKGWQTRFRLISRSRIYLVIFHTIHHELPGRVLAEVYTTSYLSFQWLSFGSLHQPMKAMPLRVCFPHHWACP